MTDTSDLPKWLTSHMKELNHALDNNLDPPDPRFPRTKEERELRNHNLECLFERALPMIAEGQTMKVILALDHNNFSTGEVMQWIRANPQRSNRYNEARKIGAEVIEDEMIAIADAENSIEDVQRSTLRINTRKWVLEKNHKERYGADPSPTNPFAGGITVVIGEVKSPYRQLPEKEGNTYDG
jgi:hypothetical protein